MASSKLKLHLLLFCLVLSLRSSAAASDGAKPAYEIKHFTQILDHFNFYPKNIRTFQQRYLINDTYWGGAASAAPIFVYLGGENNVENIPKGVGFLSDTAPYFRALVVYIEHRYYGDSYPFEDRNLHNATEFGYLSISQSLSDFATLIVDLKRNLTAERSPVIVFGCSYSGSLAAWFRLKYPHIAHGALASSGPILINFDLVSPVAYNDVISNNYRSESENCHAVIKSVLIEFENQDVKKMQKLFNICRNFPRHDEDKWYELGVNLLGRMMSTFHTASERDYPTWYKGVPPYPIKKMCEAIDNPKTGNDNFSRVADAMQVYYNSSGNITCFDLFPKPVVVKPIDQFGWQFAWQDCSEMQSSYLGNSNDSIFAAGVGNFDENFGRCSGINGAKPRRYWLTTEFGGKDIKNVLKRFGSNIIFFNGLRDPWSAGGVLESISRSIVAITAQKGAHCVDMRYNSKEDPEWLQDVRKKEIRFISKWLKQYYEDHM